ncbi:hypothetical protein SAY86_015844 [Trapa natans]|uniref:Uncharacterized protein n=1 Tax=Trapa natans TaxID=22666 RepID=A0AAN7QWL4_TRANT|nr:hypothetical protein SAY86_015844 [Trapa natans]
MASDASSGPSYYWDNMTKHEERSTEEVEKGKEEEADRSEVSSKAKKNGNVEFHTGKSKLKIATKNFIWVDEESTTPGQT